jgi:Na+-transporting methylmalonyl-CoA/oxaloacetate decarboxylase gamma subunit
MAKKFLIILIIIIIIGIMGGLYYKMQLDSGKDNIVEPEETEAEKALRIFKEEQEAYNKAVAAAIAEAEMLDAEDAAKRIKAIKDKDDLIKAEQAAELAAKQAAVDKEIADKKAAEAALKEQQRIDKILATKGRIKKRRRKNNVTKN